MSWETVKLGDVCSKIGSGATPRGGSTVYIEKGITFIRSQNVYNLSFNYSGLVFINDEAATKLKGVTIKESDVLLNITGDSVARTCIVPSDVLPARVNQHVAIVRPKSEILNPIFLNYYLASPYMQSFMLGIAVGKGTSRNAMTKDMIAEFEVPCPPIKVQQKIIDILKPYDSLIENNRKQIKLLEEAAQRLYKEWFVDLHFPGYEDVEIVDGVPEGWSKEPIGNIIGRMSRTKQIKTADYLLEGAIPVIDQSRNFVAGYTNDSEALVNTGTPIIVFGDHTRILKYIQFPFAKGADGTQLIISDRTNMPQSLLYLSLIAVDLSNYHYARHFKYLKAESILIPSQNVADEFDRLISPIFSQIQKLREQCYKLSQIRDRLLPKLMSGEIEV
jgi:hypothetical protein